ncbi:MAG: hypothetical protein VYE54_03640 [Pseudomonadota bacterium]|nr:hypothetical protein [Pseudomonadota bacterium]
MKEKKRLTAKDFRQLRALAHVRYLRERAWLNGILLPEDILGKEVPLNEALALYEALRCAESEQLGTAVYDSALTPPENSYVEFCMNMYARRDVLLAEKARFKGAASDGLSAGKVCKDAEYRERLVASLDVIAAWLSDNHPVPRLEAIPGLLDGPWKVVRPKRYTNYSKQLCDELQKWCDAGLKVPSAIEILDVWEKSPPIGVSDINKERRCFTLVNTRRETIVDCEALQKTIRNHVQYLQ